MSSTLITLSQHLAQQEVTGLIFDYNAKHDHRCVQTVSVDSPLSVYYPDGKPSKQSHEWSWYLDLLGLSIGVTYVDTARMLDLYGRLAIRSAEFSYSGDMCQFLLHAARTISQGPTFYRRDGVLIYRYLKELIMQFDRIDHHLASIGPVNNPKYPNVIHITSHSNRT